MHTYVGPVSLRHLNVCVLALLWQCILEERAGMVISSQLREAALQGALPDRFASAEAVRPKVVSVDGLPVGHGDALQMAPLDLLDATVSEMKTTRFGFESDRGYAEQMLFDYEWVVRTAIRQAQLSAAYQAKPSDTRAADDTSASRILSRFLSLSNLVSAGHRRLIHGDRRAVFGSTITSTSRGTEMVSPAVA